MMHFHYLHITQSRNVSWDHFLSTTMVPYRVLMATVSCNCNNIYCKLFLNIGMIDDGCNYKSWPQSQFHGNTHMRSLLFPLSNFFSLQINFLLHITCTKCSSKCYSHTLQLQMWSFVAIMYVADILRPLILAHHIVFRRFNNKNVHVH